MKTGFSCFFWACDGNLWKIMPLLFENGIPVVFLACDGTSGK